MYPLFFNLLYQFVLNVLSIPGNTEDIDKFNRRLVKVTSHHAEEAKQLLTLMGIPFVNVCSTYLLIFVYTN